MNYKQGVYKVGDVFIKNKTMALLEASKNKQFPLWDFNNHIFQNIDWGIPLIESLEALYIQRCKQLREKYDYLILNYSGGSDSWNILKNFINNKIHLDEIFVYWPISSTKGIYKPNIENKHPSNFLSEWDFHIKPDLEYIVKNYPKIKITVNDYSTCLLEEFTEDMFLMSGHHVNIGFFPRQTANKEAGKNIKENKEIGIIVGNDKPQLCIKDGIIYSYFIDALASTTMIPVINTNQHIEYFYWTPDIPQLPIKSAQQVAMSIKSRPEIQELFLLEKKRSNEEKNFVDKFIRSVIYPDWDTNKFQVNKSLTIFTAEYDQWIIGKYSNEKFVKSWYSFMKSYMDLIDKKYYEYNELGNRISYIGFISPLYKICNV